MELEGLALQNLKYSLFVKRRFWPIFAATFLGAFNDNMLRSGLVVLIAYSGGHDIALPARPEILVTICSALLVIPLMLFSSIAGSLADKYEKSRLVKITKIVEVGIMACAFYGFATQDIMLLMCTLFVSGTHTTFYSPIKFSILPDHLHNKELLAGNGFMAGGSYLAVLCGLITGGLLVESPGNIIGIAALCIAVCRIAGQPVHPAVADRPSADKNHLEYLERLEAYYFLCLARQNHPAVDFCAVVVFVGRLGVHVAIRQLRAGRGARQQ